ncbi:MAG: hypothetical protein ACRCX4_07250 [Bacteroidales bacterium]
MRKIENMVQPYIIYIKNRMSDEFEHRKDVSNVIRTDKGYQVIFRNNEKEKIYEALKSAMKLNTPEIEQELN